MGGMVCALPWLPASNYVVHMADIFLVGVVGSGIMGGGLAEVAARAGHDVVLRSRTIESARAALDSIAAGLDRQVSKGRIGADERDSILHRIVATDAVADLADCDLVIESVVEDLAVKKELFAELDATSSRARSSPPTPRRFRSSSWRWPPAARAGVWHPLLQPGADDEARRGHPADHRQPTRRSSGDRVRGRCGKDAIEVKDHAGFIVNALLFPYLNNAVRMCEHGNGRRWRHRHRHAVAVAASRWARFALLDLVGLDTSLAILEALYQGVPRAQLCAGADAQAAGRSRALGTQDRPRVYTY